MADSRLLWAARGGATQSLQELLTAGECNINVQDWIGNTPLHWADLYGHTQCVQLLLQHGADTSIQDEDEWTPLQLAARRGHTQCVQLLLQHGADTSIQDACWWTPLYLAVGLGHTQCVQLLLQHGANASVQAKDGRTPLHWAALLGNTQCVQLLLQHGADTNIQAKSGWTPLHWAAWRGHTQCAHLLLQQGADTNIQAENGWTPLQRAARGGHTQCVQLLLQHGADTNIQAENGWTALHAAAECGDTQCIQLLLQHGADTSIQDKDGSTPLHWAAICGQTQCVQLLLEHGADTNIQAKNGWTPLQGAARGGHTECVQLLLEHGADTNIQAEDGWTPLHCAAKCIQAQCVQLLLQHGADASIQTGERKTARMLAEEKEEESELLRRFEIPDIQGYVQTRTLEHLAELLDPAEYTIINQTNLSTNFHDVLQFQKVQELKDWVNKNNCTHIRDLKDRLQDSNLPRLSSAAVDFYAEMVKNISDMPPDDFEELCRTLITARHMCITCSATTNQQEINSSMEPLRYDAFIAHSSEDKAVVEPVIEQLEELGVQCCYGVRDFHPGRPVITSMGEAVYGSKRTVVFLSKSFMESPWCAKERELAMHKAVESREDVVIPVLMDIPPEQIPDEFKPLKYIPVDDKELIPKLVQTIKGPSESPTNGELRIALQNAQEENAFLRDQIRELTTKFRPKCQ